MAIDFFFFFSKWNLQTLLLPMVFFVLLSTSWECFIIQAKFWKLKKIKIKIVIKNLFLLLKFGYEFKCFSTINENYCQELWEENKYNFKKPNSYQNDRKESSLFINTCKCSSTVRIFTVINWFYFLSFRFERERKYKYLEVWAKRRKHEHAMGLPVVLHPCIYSESNYDWPEERMAVVCFQIKKTRAENKWKDKFSHKSELLITTCSFHIKVVRDFLQ